MRASASAGQAQSAGAVSIASVGLDGAAIREDACGAGTRLGRFSALGAPNGDVEQILSEIAAGGERKILPLPAEAVSVD